MLIQLFFLFIFLFLLFLLSQKISTYIYSIIFLVTKNRGAALAVLLFLFLPGTIIHELSHFLIAILVRVPTGELTVIPTLDKETGEVKAGRLAIAKTDPVRYTVIGLAPMIIGLALMYLIGHFLIGAQLSINHYQFIIAAFYLFFIITNTMFSSKKDLESAVLVIPIVFLIFSSLYLVGIRLFFDEKLVAAIEKTLSSLNIYLLAAVLLNLLISLFLVLNLALWKKILKR